MAFNEEDDEQTNLEFNKLLQSLGSKNRLADFSQQVPQEISPMTLTPEQQKEEADMDAALNEVMSMSSGPSLASEAQIVQEPTAAPQMDESAPAMISNRYADLLKQYNQTLGSRDIDGLQDQRRTGQLVGAGLTAGNKIAQSIAMGSGAKIDAGADAGKEVERLYAQPLEDYKEKQKQLLEEVKGLKSQSDISSELEKNDPKSDISKFMREQAYSTLKTLDPDNKMGLQGKLDNMSASQLEKLPGLKSTMSSSGAKDIGYGNNVTFTGDPLSLRNGKLFNLAKQRDYSADLDGPIARPIMYKDQFGARGLMSPGGFSASGHSQSLSNGDNKAQNLSKDKSKIEDKNNIGYYRKANIITPEDWDKVILKDKEGFEQANRDKINIVSSLKAIDSSVDEALVNPQQMASLGGIVASLFEPGKLTDEDAKRYVRRLGLSNQFRDLIQEKFSGTMNEDLAKEIKRTAKTYRESMDKVINDNALRYSKASSKGLVNSDKVDPKVLADFYYQRQTNDGNTVQVKGADGKTYNISREKYEQLKKAKETKNGNK